MKPANFKVLWPHRAVVDTPISMDIPVSASDQSYIFSMICAAFVLPNLLPRQVSAHLCMWKGKLVSMSDLNRHRQLTRKMHGRCGAAKGSN